MSALACNNPSLQSPTTAFFNSLVGLWVVQRQGKTRPLAATKIFVDARPVKTRAILPLLIMLAIPGCAHGPSEETRQVEGQQFVHGLMDLIPVPPPPADVSLPVDNRRAAPTAMDFVAAEQEAGNDACRALVDACAPSYPADQDSARVARLATITAWTCDVVNDSHAECTFVDNGRLTGSTALRCTIGLNRNTAARALSVWTYRTEVDDKGQATFPFRAVQPHCTAL